MLARSDLVATIAGELAETLALGGLALTDTSGALKEPIDRTFRALGAAEADLATATAPDGSEAAAIAFATYFALARTLDAVAAKMDVGAEGASAKRHQQWDNVKARLEAALAAAQYYGLPLSLTTESGSLIAGGGPIFTGDPHPLFHEHDAGVFERHRHDWLWR